jgi:hypothetical protein
MMKVRRDVLIDLVARNVIDDACGKAAESDIRSFLAVKDDRKWPPPLTMNEAELILKEMGQKDEIYEENILRQR